jgi:protein TonB
MQVKKNPDLDLTKNSSLYFAIGLCLMLFMTNTMLNHKSYEKEDIAQQLVEVDEEIDTEIPITEQLKTPPPPPPPPAAVEEIVIVEDVEEIEETLIESTETSQDEFIEEREVFVEDVEVEEIEENIEVPFAVVEKVPVWPGCTGKNNLELKKCFQDNIKKHLAKNFNYPERAMEMGVRGRVFVIFAIGKDGRVTGIKTRGPDQLLEKEAARIISLLPKMKPGEQRGKPVKVPYSIPINFKLQN